MVQQAQQSKKATMTTRQAADLGKAATKKPASRRQKTHGLSPEERQRIIAETAYSIAEQRGFQGGDEMADWLQAEMEVDARFAERH